jgi:hypothetical protein
LLGCRVIFTGRCDVHNLWSNQCLHLRRLPSSKPDLQGHPRKERKIMKNHAQNFLPRPTCAMCHFCLWLSHGCKFTSKETGRKMQQGCYLTGVLSLNESVLYYKYLTVSPWLLILLQLVLQKQTNKKYKNRPAQQKNFYFYIASR